MRFLPGGGRSSFAELTLSSAQQTRLTYPGVREAAVAERLEFRQGRVQPAANILEDRIDQPTRGRGGVGRGGGEGGERKREK